jgi:hypothetical protein
MAYQVTRTIRKKNGRSYTYTFWQMSVRVPGRKTPKTIYLGRGSRPLLPFIGRVPEDQQGLAYIERQMAKYPSAVRERPGGPLSEERQQIKAQAASARHARTVATEIGRFNKDTGLRMNLHEVNAPVVPIEKTTTAAAPSSAPAAAADAPSEAPSPEAAGPAPDTGEAK